MISRLFCCATLAFTVSSGASAQVYRCTIDGQTVFSGTPCAIDAEQINVRPSSGPGSYDDALRARLRALQDARAVREIEYRRTAERASRSITSGGIGGSDKSDRCKDIARERASAEKLSQIYISPDNIKREQEKLKHYEQRDFFECAPSNMR